VVVADPADLLRIECLDRDLGTGVGVVPNLLTLGLRKWAGLAEHVLVDAELADVVDERRLGEPDREIGAPAARQRELLGDAGDALGVTFGARVLGIELAREGTEPVEAAGVLGLWPELPPSSSAL
jgi:hypothetical protein